MKKIIISIVCLISCINLCAKTYSCQTCNATGIIVEKITCETCNGKRWITENDDKNNFKVLSFTKEQWQKIIKIVEINGSINLNKSQVTIKITDHE